MNDNPDESTLGLETKVEADVPQTAFWLGLLGIAAVLMCELGLAARGLLVPSKVLAFSWWMTVGFAAGLALRAVRRKVFFGSDLRPHQAFSIDVLFQGAVLLHPQLPYPTTETEFIRREGDLPAARVTPWFRVRSTSAVAVPVCLTAIAAGLGGMWVLAAVCGLVGLGAIVKEAIAWSWPEISRHRLVLAVLLSVGAAAGEGFAFVEAAQVVRPECATWLCFVLYFVTLTCFELSPIPLAMGSVELGYGVLAMVPGVELPGLMLVLAYRAWRGLPVLLMTAFYLGRYKLTVVDLYDPSLPSALSQSRRPPTGWTSEETEDGPLLSVVIPAYNEAERLPVFLPGVVSFCERIDGSAEVLVVDDGSTDETAAYVVSVSGDHPMVRLVSQESNQGKGAAVRRGVMEATGRFVLFADADGATPIGEATKLLPVAQSGIEVVIGSRKAAGGDVERSVIRDLMGATFYRLTNLLAVPGVSDTQCGFKMFRRVAAERLFPLATETGWAFDVELLFLAQKIGMAIVEVPVNWAAVEGSKISPVKDAIKMFMAVLRIRRRCAGLASAMRKGPASQ